MWAWIGAGAAAGWLLLAAVVGVVVGRSIRLAECRRFCGGHPEAGQ